MAATAYRDLPVKDEFHRGWESAMQACIAFLGAHPTPDSLVEELQSSLEQIRLHSNEGNILQMAENGLNTIRQHSASTTASKKSDNSATGNDTSSGCEAAGRTAVRCGEIPVMNEKGLEAAMAAYVAEPLINGLASAIRSSIAAYLRTTEPVDSGEPPVVKHDLREFLICRFLAMQSDTMNEEQLADLVMEIMAPYLRSTEPDTSGQHSNLEEINDEMFIAALQCAVNPMGENLMRKLCLEAAKRLSEPVSDNGPFNSHADARLTKAGGMSFGVWSYILTLENKAHDNPTGETTAEGWRDYYENNHTPHEAIEEDFNYAD